MNTLQHLSKLLKDAHMDEVSGRLDKLTLARYIDQALNMAAQEEQRNSTNGGLINSDQLYKDDDQH